LDATTPRSPASYHDTNTSAYCSDLRPTLKNSDGIFHIDEQVVFDTVFTSSGPNLGN